GAAVFSLHEEGTGSSRRKLLLLVGAFSLVLLIACANVASLLLARGIERAKELAIRATLGAGRLRVVRRLLTGCLLLAGLGGGVGVGRGGRGVRGGARCRDGGGCQALDPCGYSAQRCGHAGLPRASVHGGADSVDHIVIWSVARLADSKAQFDRRVEGGRMQRR